MNGYRLYIIGFRHLSYAIKCRLIKQQLKRLMAVQFNFGLMFIGNEWGGTEYLIDYVIRISDLI